MEYISNSIKDTEKFAKQMAKGLRGGDVLGLVGNLGAGKTTFTQALGKALGVKQTMTSPTFVLMKIYPINHVSAKYLCHIDAYRLTTQEDLVAIGANDYIGQPETITVIEWADMVKSLLPPKTIIATLSLKEKTTRTIDIAHQNFDTNSK
jgi:tRNA threonylcarbamoyladenosine biosynthesis protein TsaE